MTEKIFKTRIPLEAIDAQVRLELPKDSKILTIQLQGTSPVVWYSFDVEKAEDREWRTIAVVGTGLEFESGNWRYISTVLVQAGYLVLHFYEVLG
jgi:hypothetical protein